MYELLLTLVLLGLLGSIAFALHGVAVPALIGFGLWLVVAGFAIGLPASAVYHALLRRSLLRIDALPAGWYWRPTSLHARVPRADRRAVLGFCYVGAAGFFAIVLGCVAVALAALRTAGAAVS